MTKRTLIPSLYKPAQQAAPDEISEPEEGDRFDPDAYEMDRAIEREWEAEDVSGD